VLLCPWDYLALSLFRNTIFAYQPFLGCRIHERQVDLVTVFSAEILERSVGDKRVQEFELPFGDQFLGGLDSNAQDLGRSLPGIGILLDNCGSGPVIVGVISNWVVLLVQLSQGAAGYAWIANSQSAARNQVPESGATHAKQLA
jgi:hypothetical protein